MKGCIFCKIVNGEIPANIVHKDDDVLAFEDIKPEAPTHIVIIPRRHIARISDLGEADTALAGKLVVVAAKLARENNIDETGYRLVANCNKDAGQVVFHLHMHLLGGRALGWPPG